jgi:hypothetical protein
LKEDRGTIFNGHLQMFEKIRITESECLEVVFLLSSDPAQGLPNMNYIVNFTL